MNGPHQRMNGPHQRQNGPAITRRHLLAGGLVALCAACSIRVDAGPRDISDDEKPSISAVGTSIAIESGAQSTIYLLAPQVSSGPSQLKPVGRAESPTPQNVLTTLFAGPNDDDQRQRLRTNIPPGTVLKRTVELGSQVLLVDVSDTLLQTSGDALVDAVAQIVFTACDLQGIDSVQLEVDGLPHEWTRGNGTSTTAPLTKFDFPERDPSSQPDFPAVPSQTPDSTA